MRKFIKLISFENIKTLVFALATEIKGNFFFNKKKN